LKILILGIGNAQADALAYCKQRGVEVYACSSTSTGPGKQYADQFALIDIKNIAQIQKYVQANAIDLVYSVGSDIAMPTFSTVSENLGLPCFISSETARICQNKVLMREHLGPDFSGNLSFKALRSPEEIRAWEIFPCILKPVDSQGQRGVFLLKTKEDFYTYYPQSLKYSKSKTVIVEEYVAGQEISVNLHVRNGEILFFQTSDRIVFSEYPGGLVKTHRIPSQHIYDEKPIYDLVQFVINTLGIRNGPTYFQIKLGKGRPKLIEVTPRHDGCHMWRLIKEATGVDLLDCTFKHLFGDELPSLVPAFTRPVQKTYCLHFLCEPPEKPVDRNKFQIRDPLFLEWYYEQGEMVRPINGYMEKVGYIIENR
jgi:biotin carboxylase